MNGVDPPQPPPFPVVVKLRVADFAKSDGSTAVANVRATTLHEYFVLGCNGAGGVQV